MKRTIFFTAAAGILAGSLAMADALTDQVVADLQGQGFTAIEVKNGLSQMKVEAIRDNLKVEVVYDRATGQILKQEQESAAGETIRPGVSIREEDKDFVRGARVSARDESEDDNGGDRGRGQGGDDDEGDDNDHRGGHDDDDDRDDDRDDDDDDDDRDDDDDDRDDDDDDRDDDDDDDDSDDD